MGDVAGPGRDDRRLAALAETGLMDSPPEAPFDRATRLAARLLGAPVALVCLIDDRRHFVKSQVGLPEPWASLRETPLAHSFCRHAVSGGRPLAVADARAHPHFRDIPAVLALGLVAYLGVPLTTRCGQALGTLCVIDGRPRQWTDDDRAALDDLAAMLTVEFDLRRERARRGRADCELRLLSSALGHANDAVMICEAEPLSPPGPRITYVNEGFTRLTGYAPEEVLGQTPRVLQGPKTDPAIRATIRRHLEAAEPIRVELLNYRKDGSEFWAEVTIRPLADQAGRVTHLVGVQRDVTDRKEAEARLRESERRLRGIFDGTYQFIGLLAPDGRLLEANRAALEFAGVEFAEVAGLPFSETPWWAGSPELRARLEAAIAEAARGQFVRFEADHPGADGRVITVDFSLSPVRDESGRVVLLIPEGRDITKRKRAEEALRHREQLLQLATQAAGLGVWDWDLTTGRMTLSGEALRIAGLPPDGFAGTPEGYAALIHPDDRAAVRRAVAAARHSRTDYRCEHRCVRPDGATRWVDARGRFVYDDATGAAVRMIGVGLDITDRRALEQQARERAEQLAEADRRKDEFLAMLAHELRNPLAPVAHAVRVLELRDGEPALRRQMRELITRQVRDLSRLVDDLLDVARITRGKIQLRLTDVDLAEVVRRSVISVSGLIQARRHRVEVELSDRPVVLRADPLRLEQVIVNLLINAAKYTDPGGEIAVAATSDPSGGGVVVRVSDNGMGISPDLLPRVFDPFTQADRTLGRAEGGLGIGLTLVRDLVRLHGGTVEARSEGPGRGSEFVVRLPAASAGDSSFDLPRLPEGPPPPRQASLRVLVVDDNVQAADSLLLVLGCWGHAAAACHHGRDALAAAQEFRPDVVLLDIGLPDLDGYTVARALRDRPEHAGAVLVAVTGYDRDVDRERAEGAGFDHYFFKPVDLDALERLLASVSPPAAAPAPRVSAATA